MLNAFIGIGATFLGAFVLMNLICRYLDNRRVGNEPSNLR